VSACQPVAIEQIQAAGRLHTRLVQWKLADAALELLRSAAPGFDPRASLLKTVAVNEIYATQVMATARMATHIASVMTASEIPTGPELVEAIAALPNSPGRCRRNFISFAAKFCHFFVDSKRYRIYDDAARETLRVHLGESYLDDPQRPYVGFCRNSSLFCERNELEGNFREVDQYLWLTGMYMRWLRQRDRAKILINAELLELFRKPQAASEDLDSMLPSCFERTFVVNQRT
jgi:hypothetical protein